MADREMAIIKGLECCHDLCGVDLCRYCPYGGDISQYHCQSKLMTDALELLKAQEPRVMLQTEVMMENNALYEGCVWLETRYGSLAPCFIGFKYQGEIKIYSPFLRPAKDPESNETWWGIEHYGHIWRCWTARPTDEQRKGVKWDE